MATCRISQSAEGKIIKPWNLYAVAELMEDRGEPPLLPGKLNVKSGTSLADILIFYIFCCSVRCSFFFIFQDVFDFLASIDIHGVRIHYHFLSFILSVG